MLQGGCVSHNGIGELVILDGTMKGTDYIDILDHDNHDKPPIHTARNIQMWLDEHDVQMFQWPA